MKTKLINSIISFMYSLSGDISFEKGLISKKVIHSNLDIIACYLDSLSLKEIVEIIVRLESESCYNEELSDIELEDSSRYFNFVFSYLDEEYSYSFYEGSDNGIYNREILNSSGEEVKSPLKEYLFNKLENIDLLDEVGFSYSEEVD